MCPAPLPRLKSHLPAALSDSGSFLALNRVGELIRLSLNQQALVDYVRHSDPAVAAALSQYVKNIQ